MRLATLLVTLITSTASAQTTPPPATPSPAPSSDAILDEQVAQQLVDRAQELLDAKLWLDAKQLAVEALVKSPKGPSADKARYIIKAVNQHLDIKEDPAPTPPSSVAPPGVTQAPATLGDGVDMTPIDSSQPRPFDPSRDPPPSETPAPQNDRGNPRTAATVHGAFYGGVIGATIGAFAAHDNPAAGAIPAGIGVGVGAGLGSRALVGKLGWDAARVRTAGSLTQWGGVIGGLFGEAVTGAGSDKPTARGVLLGGSIGATVGLGLGAAYATKNKLSRGDVALVDTFAGIGAVGGLTIGMLMQPAQPEAYSVNAILGVSGGILVGVIAGPQTNTTQRRMLRVAVLSAAGGAIPFLLYAAIYDSNSKADERIVGLLASAGLVGGAYLGFHLTRGMDAGLDVSPGNENTDDAPVALVGRNSDGSWRVGGLGIAPVQNSRGATLTLVGATF
jgi:hypothetical protein